MENRGGVKPTGRKIISQRRQVCLFNKTNTFHSSVIRPKKTSQHYAIYSNHARQILTDITELRDLVLDKRKEYIMCSNAFSLYGAQRFMSDEDRKKFDNETGFLSLLFLISFNRHGHQAMHQTDKRFGNSN